MLRARSAPADVTAVSVLWNEAQRARHLLACLVEHFTRVVVVVQKSTDDTFGIADSVLRPTDALVADEWRGNGDFSMPLALSHVKTGWVFVISGDEYPSADLLASLPAAVDKMELDGNSGAFINFEETIEDIPYKGHGAHVRLFRSTGDWEARHHSGTSHEGAIRWPIGVISHHRSLDEVVADYVRIYAMIEHDGPAHLLPIQRGVLHDVVDQMAEVYSWPWVKGHEWWPEVQAIAFP